jgi:hypothetical protein
MTTYNFQVGDLVSVYQGRGLASGHFDGVIKAIRQGELQAYAVELFHPTPSGTWMLNVSGDKLERI